MAEDWSRPVVHWEIQAKDADKMSAFYSGMFNWTIGEGRVRDISAGIGAPDTITGHIRPADRSGVVRYIQVLKLADSLARCAELGGKVTHQPRDLPTGL